MKEQIFILILASLFAITADAGCATAGGSGSHPSKLCVGVSSDWYCPYNAACNLAGGGCFLAHAVTGCDTDTPASTPATATDAGATSGGASAASAPTSTSTKNAAASLLVGEFATSSILVSGVCAAALIIGALL
ncbi:hypothetical protein GQ53DRAFT_830882 [Thozetella sp. PMI_491]|nr:hypothetical protein GQ53DRAFT_830882 [Thozetella sp. PMI_491]